MGKRSSSSKSSKPLPKAILVFAESQNDSQSIQALVSGLAKPLASSIKVRRKPLVLIKGREKAEAARAAMDIAQVVAADRVDYDVRGIFAHQDCDALEPAHRAASKQIESHLAEQGASPAFAVTPAWEIEAWWFLFPEAVVRAFPSWRRPDDYLGRDVGLVEQAKEKFSRAVRPPGAKPTFRGYQESDSVAIAKKIGELDSARKPEGISDSYRCFVRRVDECAAGF